MPKYVIERELAGAGDLSSNELKGIATTSCDVLNELGTKIQWVESYMTDNKVYCVYIAPDESLIRKHAQMGGFPINSINEVKAIIDPTTSE